MFPSVRVILSFRHTGQGHSPKVLYSYARCDRRVAWGAKVNLLNPTGCVYQQVYNLRTDILPTLYFFVQYLSQNKQRYLHHIT